MQIKASIAALKKIDNLPKPKVESTGETQIRTHHKIDRGYKGVHDLLDWLWLTFGFQVKTVFFFFFTMGKGYDFIYIKWGFLI